MSKNYIFSNILLRFFPSIESHTLFLSSPNIPPRTDWDSLSGLLLDRFSWVKNRQRLHTKILNKIVNSYDAQSKKVWQVFYHKIGFKDTKQPIVIIIRGTSGSGKTTFINQVLDLKSGIISPDKVRVLLKNNCYLTGKDDNQYDLESYAITSWLCEELFKNKYNLVIERTLEYIEDLQKIVDLCVKHGYQTIYLADIDSPLNICLNRLRGRQKKEGPVVPVNAAKECYQRVKNNRISIIKYLKNLRKTNSIIELYENNTEGKVFNVKSRVVNYHPNR